MNYVYDILLNFNPYFYEFFDWNLKDRIDHIRKIPIFKVSTKMLEDLFCYDLKLNDEFLTKIYQKTELFLGRKVKNIPYAFLITDTRKVVAVKIENKKVLLSDLLIDEEEVALEMVQILPFTDISYEIKKGIKKQILKTRKEMEIEKSLKNSIQKLKEENDIEKLKYIYYECFNQKETEKNLIVKAFEKQLSHDYIHISKKLDDLLKLTQKTV